MEPTVKANNSFLLCGWKWGMCSALDQNVFNYLKREYFKLHVTNNLSSPEIREVKLLH